MKSVRADKRPTPKVANKVMGAREWGLIVILALVWGGSFFFIGVAVKELPPLTIVLCRVALAALILAGVVRLKGLKVPTSPGMIGSFFAMGALNNVIPFILIVWGQTHIDSGLASILNATTPIFSVLLAHFWTKQERLTMGRAVGVLVGWLGVAALIGIESLHGLGVEVLGQIAILGASVTYAFAAIYAQRFRQVHPLVIATGMLTASTIMMTPLALLIDQPWTLTPGLPTIGALVGLATVCTSLAYLIYFRVLNSAGPTNILLVTFLVPISAILLGSLVLGEQLGWNAFVGMTLIFVGLIAIDGRLLKKLKKR